MNASRQRPRARSASNLAKHDPAILNQSDDRNAVAPGKAVFRPSRANPTPWEEDLKVLSFGWERWAAAHEDSFERRREDFLVEAHARAYQRNRAATRQIAHLELELLATISGVISVWQVELCPAQGVSAQPLSVIVPARDTRQAVSQALARYPQYVAGPVKRLN